MIYLKKHILEKENKVVNEQINVSLNDGLKLKPRNLDKYDVPNVDTIMFFNKSFIEKILHKKLVRKLNYYLKYILELLNDDSASGDTIREALNDLTRYKSIVEYKYQQYLDEKFLEQFMHQMDTLEKELKMRLLYQSFYDEPEETKGKSR